MGFYLVKIGSEARPATSGDIAIVSKELEELSKSECKDKIYVTGCDISVQYVPSTTQGMNIVQIGNDMRPVTKKDIEELTKAINDMQNSNKNFLVTHHCVNVKYLSRD